MQTSRPPERAPAARLAGYQPAHSILSQSLRELATQWEHEDGQSCTLTLDVTAEGETAQSLFASVEQGSRDICYIASGYLSARVPELGVLDLPFSVTDRHAALAALDGDAGAMLSAAVESSTGYKVLGYWDNGFRHFSNGVRPLRNADDCAGLSIRTLDSASYRATFQALGMRPVTADVRELVRMVRERDVDAQENPLTNFASFGLDRYHRYLSMTSHCFGVLLLACCRTWHDALGPHRQLALARAARKATRLQRELAAMEDITLLGQLARSGVDVLARDQIDLASMRQAIRTVDADLRRRLPTRLLEAYLP